MFYPKNPFDMLNEEANNDIVWIFFQHILIYNSDFCQYNSFPYTANLQQATFKQKCEIPQQGKE